MSKFFFIVAVGLLTACGKLSTNMPTMQQQKEADASDLRVRDFISIDTFGSNNEIVLAKMCTEDTRYKYIYQLKGGTWVASNEQWCVGNSININASSNDN